MTELERVEEMMSITMQQVKEGGFTPESIVVEFEKYLDDGGLREALKNYQDFEEDV